MTKSTLKASSHGSDSSVPNTGMNMGQFPWPQPAYIPGYAPPPNYLYGMPPNGTHGAAPQYAPSAGVGAGVAHHAFQPGQNGHHPPVVANVPDATYVGPGPPLTVAAPPSQYPPTPPPYHQPFPSNSLPGAVNPYVPPMLPQGYLQQLHGAGLATGSAPLFLPQVPTFSVAEKRITEDLGERDTKRTKVASHGMKNDPLFKSMLDQHGQFDGMFMCSKDGMRHWDNGCTKLAPEGARLSYAAACQDLMDFAPVAPMAAPTTEFTYHYSYPMPVALMSQNMQVAPPAASVDAQAHGTPSFLDPALCLSQPQENDMVTEPVEDEDEDDDAEFWEANEIRDIQDM
ncbi:hypothetical protein BDR05DRAFT_953584 [Suillus weaverae]|nr:hypothetical protein BDR05DRAFT_953584 [Suillus weaverae]